METSIYSQLSLVIVLGAVVSLIMRLLRQPLIMGYILTGILVGPSVLGLIHDVSAFESFSQIGITLLLFIIGLGLNANVIRGLGKVSFLGALSTLVGVGGLGVATSLLLGFDIASAAIIGISLFFSSTIIILKVLSDQRETSRLHGQIATGIILVEDIVATIVLLVVAAVGREGGISTTDIGMLLLKGIGLGAGLAIVGTKIMPHLSKFFADSQESLFLFTVAWGIGISGLFGLAGYSHEVGALFAGVSLASLPYSVEMASRLKPLRDFFIVLFFVVLGEKIHLDAISASIVPALILSLIVLIGKPIFVMISLGLQGYTRLTSFKTGIHLSQISEFSIILVSFSALVGLTSDNVTNTVMLVALVTIGISTYLMKYDDQLFKFFDKYLHVFERSDIRERSTKRVSNPIILFGYHRGGHEFLQTFRDMHQRYLVVDYDPLVIEHLENQGIRHAYGDATDEEFLDEIRATDAKLVVSTVTDIRVNRSLLAFVHKRGRETTFICHANSYDEAAELYRYGASYVILPHFIGSERVSGFIKKNGFDPKVFANFREKHILTIGRKALDA
ncbi:MAG: cation:proton antiporter [Candidatus Saccharimonadales bacterium]|jgi:Kef-type K+ transport system membrane component KefB